jgi:hypothetical protein
MAGWQAAGGQQAVRHTGLAMGDGCVKGTSCARQSLACSCYRHLPQRPNTAWLAVWAMNAEGLAELLTVRGGGAAAPQLPSTLPSSYGESVLHCPVLLLLQRHLEVAVATSARAVLATVPARRTPAVVTLETVLACVVRVPPPRGEGAWVAAAVQHAAPELAELEGRALRIMDQLYAAGYRINVYRGERVLGAAAGCCWPVCGSLRRWCLQGCSHPRHEGCQQPRRTPAAALANAAA